MSQLTIYPLIQAGEGLPLPLLQTTDPALISQELGQRGLAFQQWPTRGGLDPASPPEVILASYSAEIARVQQGGLYPTVDAVSIGPDHPKRQQLRQQFLAEHTHADDEVRFFVDGRGLFCLHIGEEVLQLLCQQNDWIRVPAGTPHWFDMGERPHFTAIRFFNNTEGWVAAFTGSTLADRYPLLER
jgi:1,2-dihydroxy-3-keto-5-methylthiopentene dioxygenase